MTLFAFVGKCGFFGPAGPGDVAARGRAKNPSPRAARRGRARRSRRPSPRRIRAGSGRRGNEAGIGSIGRSFGISRPTSIDVDKLVGVQQHVASEARASRPASGRARESPRFAAPDVRDRGVRRRSSPRVAAERRAARPVRPATRSLRAHRVPIRFASAALCSWTNGLFSSARACGAPCVTSRWQHGSVVSGKSNVVSSGGSSRAWRRCRRCAGSAPPAATASTPSPSSTALRGHPAGSPARSSARRRRSRSSCPPTKSSESRSASASSRRRSARHQSRLPASVFAYSSCFGWTDDCWYVSREQDQPVERFVFQPPCDQLGRQPVEQFRVRRLLAVEAEVVGRADQALRRSGAARGGSPRRGPSAGSSDRRSTARVASRRVRRLRPAGGGASGRSRPGASTGGPARRPARAGSGRPSSAAGSAARRGRGRSSRRRRGRAPSRPGRRGSSRGPGSMKPGPERRGHAVVVGLADRVELVVVAAGALHRHARGTPCSSRGPCLRAGRTCTLAGRSARRSRCPGGGSRWR